MKLYAVLASEPVPDVFLDIRAATYLEALIDFPAWAVNDAVRMWIRGDCQNLKQPENRNFVPKPAELIRLVRFAISSAASDLARTEKLATALAARSQKQIAASIQPVIA